jgi:hypothetical protein
MDRSHRSVPRLQRQSKGVEDFSTERRSANDNLVSGAVLAVSLFVSEGRLGKDGCLAVTFGLSHLAASRRRLPLFGVRQTTNACDEIWSAPRARHAGGRARSWPTVAVIRPVVVHELTTVSVL